MVARSAEANTSAGAPAWSWSTSAAEPSKENVTVTPGWEASKDVPSSVKVPVRESAAKTTTSLGRLDEGPAAHAGSSTRASAPASARRPLTVRPRW